MIEIREAGSNRRNTQLKLSEPLQKENIVEIFVADDRCIHIALNHKYEDTTIISDIDKKSWQRTVKNFREAAEKKGVEQKHIDMLDNTLADNYQTIDHISRDNPKEDDNESPEIQKAKDVYSTFKYSKNRTDSLHEAVIIYGLPYFIKYDKEGGKLIALEKIEEPTRILRPPNIEEYPYEPYKFANTEELDHYLNKAKDNTTTKYSLYQRWKSIVKKYNDQDEYKLILIAIDIFWSYFHDLFPTTHYTAAIGDNGTGKSSIGDTFEYGAYRCVNLTNPSAPNVFRILGVIEPGQCTLILDEADRLEESSEMQSILKTGYRYGKRVPKTNTNSWKQEYFFTYGLKVLLAENSPSQWKAKGILDRTFPFTTYAGDPLRLIEETIETQGDPQRQKLLDELNGLRKLMLIYRMVHFDDPIIDIDIGVKGRNMQLCKPYIQLFYGTPAQREVEETLQKFLDTKNEKRSNSREAILIPIIRTLLSEETRKGDNKIPVGRIWERIKIDLGGESSSNNPNECYTDYGTLYRNTITKIICDKFGAEVKRLHAGKRVLEFNLAKLESIERAYSTHARIHTTLRKEGKYIGNNSQKNNGDGGDGYDNSAGMPPTTEYEYDIPYVENYDKKGEDIKDISWDDENIVKQSDKQQSKTTEKEGSILWEPSEPSPLSPETSTEEKFWSIYQYLLEKEQGDPSNHMTIDKDTVCGTELVSCLYDSGEFSRTEANEFIAKAVQSSQLDEVSYGTYRRRT